ncbi:Phosphoglucomutase-3 [Dinochytrium kinnereticum]|nr:Phosphoglucomutase-3 [Dinochytrium kinnereticum]
MKDMRDRSNQVMKSLAKVKGSMAVLANAMNEVADGLEVLRNAKGLDEKRWSHEPKHGITRTRHVFTSMSKMLKELAERTHREFEDPFLKMLEAHTTNVLMIERKVQKQTKEMHDKIRKSEAEARRMRSTVPLTITNALSQNSSRIDPTKVLCDTITEHLSAHTLELHRLRASHQELIAEDEEARISDMRKLFGSLIAIFGGFGEGVVTVTAVKAEGDKADLTSFMPTSTSNSQARQSFEFPNPSAYPIPFIPGSVSHDQVISHVDNIGNFRGGAVLSPVGAPRQVSTNEAISPDPVNSVTSQHDAAHNRSPTQQQSRSRRRQNPIQQTLLVSPRLIPKMTRTNSNPILPRSALLASAPASELPYIPPFATSDRHHIVRTGSFDSLVSMAVVPNKVPPPATSLLSPRTRDTAVKSSAFNFSASSRGSVSYFHKHSFDYGWQLRSRERTAAPSTSVAPSEATVKEIMPLTPQSRGVGERRGQAELSSSHGSGTEPEIQRYGLSIMTHKPTNRELSPKAEAVSAWVGATSAYVAPLASIGISDESPSSNSTDSLRNDNIATNATGLSPTRHLVEHEPVSSTSSPLPALPKPTTPTDFSESSLASTSIQPPTRFDSFQPTTPQTVSRINGNGSLKRHSVSSMSSHASSTSPPPKSPVYASSPNGTDAISLARGEEPSPGKVSVTSEQPPKISLPTIFSSINASEILATAFSRRSEDSIRPPLLRRGKRYNGNVGSVGSDSGSDSSRKAKGETKTSTAVPVAFPVSQTPVEKEVGVEPKVMGKMGDSKEVTTKTVNTGIGVRGVWNFKSLAGSRSFESVLSTTPAISDSSSSPKASTSVAPAQTISTKSSTTIKSFLKPSISTPTLNSPTSAPQSPSLFSRRSPLLGGNSSGSRDKRQGIFNRDRSNSASSTPSPSISGKGSSASSPNSSPGRDADKETQLVETVAKPLKKRVHFTDPNRPMVELATFKTSDEEDDDEDSEDVDNSEDDERSFPAVGIPLHGGGLSRAPAIRGSNRGTSIRVGIVGQSVGDKIVTGPSCYSSANGMDVSLANAITEGHSAEVFDSDRIKGFSSLERAVVRDTFDPATTSTPPDPKALTQDSNGAKTEVSAGYLVTDTVPNLESDARHSKNPKGVRTLQSLYPDFFNIESPSIRDVEVRRVSLSGTPQVRFPLVFFPPQADVQSEMGSVVEGNGRGRSSAASSLRSFSEMSLDNDEIIEGDPHELVGAAIAAENEKEIGEIDSKKEVTDCNEVVATSEDRKEKSGDTSGAGNSKSIPFTDDWVVDIDDLPPGIEMLIALYPFSSRSDKEMSLEKGDVVAVHKRHQTWIYATKLRKLPRRQRRGEPANTGFFEEASQPSLLPSPGSIGTPVSPNAASRKTGLRVFRKGSVNTAAEVTGKGKTGGTGRNILEALAAYRVPIEELAERWLELDQNPESRKTIKGFLDDQNTVELERLLRNPIKFGTAGLRASMEAGFACMNDLTVIQASQGLAAYVLDNVEDAKERGVIIGHDHRYHSLDFARLTAAVFLHYGYKVYLYRGLVHTPMVPFAVKHLHAACGVMVTASHNPKNDNGYKVYWENSCQIIPPHDSGIAKRIVELQEPLVWDYDLWKTHPNCCDKTDELVEDYFKSMSTLCHFEEGNRNTQLKYVYTAMHGVGAPFASRALEVFHLPPAVPVPSQIEPNPDFPTVAFPNPEERGALNLALKQAEKNNISLVLANDPDADRFAAAERQPDGKWHTFTGDQIGVILAAGSLINASEDGMDLTKLAMVASTVSSKMLRSMAEREGFYFEETLTGFKWMSNRLIELQEEKGLIPRFAYEEAIGFMVHDGVFDKDGVTALVAFVELAVRQHAQGRTMKEFLGTLFAKYGYHASSNHYFICHSGPTIKRIFGKMRHGEDGGSEESFGRTNFKRLADGAILRYPTEIAHVPVMSIRDLTNGFEVLDLPAILRENASARSESGDGMKIEVGSFVPSLPVSASSEMITFTLTNGCVFTLRTSGTEPKIKYYVEMKGESREEVENFLVQVVKAIGDDLFEAERNNLQ